MNLEYNVLNHLNINDNGKFSDVTFLDDDYKELKKVLNTLKENNYIVLDKCSSRNFEAFGISNERKKCLKAKIKINGKIYLHSLNKELAQPEEETKRKRSFKLAYFFSF